MSLLGVWIVGVLIDRHHRAPLLHAWTLLYAGVPFALGAAANRDAKLGVRRDLQAKESPDAAGLIGEESNANVLFSRAEGRIFHVVCEAR
jgi:hypothetical protein